VNHRNVLVIGYQAFAARGLGEELASKGFVVDGFARRMGTAELGYRSTIHGSVSSLLATPGFDDHYDIVINFLLIKDGGIDPNTGYLDALLEFCRRKTVNHLIHISSVSVYPGDVTHVNESTAIESNPNEKGKYGALKVATDQFLKDNLHGLCRLTLLRPGFILGKGLSDPIVGMAFRTPYNRLLVLGSRTNTVPITTRKIVHRALVQLALDDNRQSNKIDAYILVSSNSPTREKFLHFLCQNAGMGKAVIGFPSWLWKVSGYAAGVAEKLLGTGFNAKKTLINAARNQSFDSSRSASNLGISLDVDWQEELLESLEGQAKNFATRDFHRIPRPDLSSVGFIGWGRIVKQKHLPALKQLKFSPKILAYDVQDRQDETGQLIQTIPSDTLEPAQLYVVASPGPAHIQSISPLSSVECPILVEKPLAYNMEELEAWKSFAATRKHKIVTCHNYRYKQNVLEMTKHLATYNPGEIKHVDLWFQSPPVSNESAAWLKDERASRTLLYDYSIHFLDVATMFCNGPWSLDSVRSELNARDETALIQGQATCEKYSLSFLIRQGAMPRRSRIRFVFQNYDVTLGFFPETFSYSMSNESPYLERQNAGKLGAAIRRKIIEKLRHKDSDHSHAEIISEAIDASRDSQISVENLYEFYKLLFTIGDRVYS
jgi:nucleoside-diphosphate-sugar epimerase